MSHFRYWACEYGQLDTAAEPLSLSRQPHRYADTASSGIEGSNPSRSAFRL